MLISPAFFSIPAAREAAFFSPTGTDMKLSITNEPDLHKKSSLILSTVFAVITAVGPTILDAIGTLPPEISAALPEGPARWVATAAFVLIGIARITYARKTDA